MATTTINSAGSLFEGTASADVIQFETGAAAVRSSVDGAGGNDSIIISGESFGVVTSTTLEGGDGDDTIKVYLSGGLDESSIAGGAGDDSIDFQGLELTDTTVVGGDGADSIFVAYSGPDAFISDVVVNAGAGDDSIEVYAASGSTNLAVGGGSGNDTIVVNIYTAASNVTVLGGGGDDSISIYGDIGSAAFIDADSGADGGGNDTIYMSADVGASSTVLGGGGDDSIYIDGDIGSDVFINADSEEVGGGNDSMDFDGNVGNGSTVLGGGGDDSIDISGDIGSAVFFNADSEEDGGGDDTIDIGGQVGTATTVQGKGGSDIISASAVMLGQVNGGAGADTIELRMLGDSAAVLGADGSDFIQLSASSSDAVFSGNFGFVGGGSGADTIDANNDLFTANASSNTIQGGGGLDSISFEMSNDGLSIVFAGSGSSIYGGAAADTIELGGTISAGYGDGFAIGFNDLSDSSIDAIDKVSGGASLSGVNFSFDTAAGITSFTIGIYNDSDESTPTVDAGVADDSSFEFASADSTLTSRVEDLDAILSTRGTLVSFQADGEDYIFIQGGAVGVADDAVIEVHEAVSGFQVGTDNSFFADLTS